MNLLDAEEGKEYLISSVNTEDDEEMEDFLFSLGLSNIYDCISSPI